MFLTCMSLLFHVHRLLIMMIGIQPSRATDYAAEGDDTISAEEKALARLQKQRAQELAGN